MIKKIFSKICPVCKKEFNVERFVRNDGKIKINKKETTYCCRACANSRIMTKDVRKKISSSLIKKRNDVNSILELHNKKERTFILLNLNLSCFNCGWKVEGVVCDLHHKSPVAEGRDDSHKNLCYLCPNCHRLAHWGKLDVSKLKSLEDEIGEKWRDREKFIDFEYNSRFWEED